MFWVMVESSVWNMLSLRFFLEKLSWQLAGGDGNRYKEWLPTRVLSELEMGIRAMKLDESTLDMLKLTGWGNEEAQLEVGEG